MGKGSYELSLAILAHVDSGKTTLTEAVLYTCGRIRKLGRVDHGDAFLDNDSQERERGITIYSKPARFRLMDRNMVIVDTPGHSDLSTEAERALTVCDAVILVISASDGVTPHSLLLWKLLAHYELPVIIFINKTDQPGTDARKVLEQIRNRFSRSAVYFDKNAFSYGRDPERSGTDGGFVPPLLDISDDSLMEDIAVADDRLLTAYLDGKPVEGQEIAGLILERKLFPVLSGSALRLDGVDRLLTLVYMLGSQSHTSVQEKGPLLRVYRISRDENGVRLTWCRVLEGEAGVRQNIYIPASGREEKISGIRLYSGEKYENADIAEKGQIIAVTGLEGSRAGDLLGENAAHSEKITGMMKPVIRRSVLVPGSLDSYRVYEELRKLEEEEPALEVTGGRENISVMLSGQVQGEILLKRLADVFGNGIRLGEEQVVYKETILDSVEGIGHFEPLRHYAEVHLLLEPGEPGSGLVFESSCSVDELDINWQRLVLTHLREKRHIGVLTGSEITDIRITLTAGRAHEKHTEGGDFREATWRAVRQGLMSAESVLLEPVYDVKLTVPVSQTGRVLTDIRRMSGSGEITGDTGYGSHPQSDPEDAGSMVTVVARIPVSEFGDYSQELAGYTHGSGSVSLSFGGYEACHNAEEIIAARGYNADGDLDNPSSSVFCSHGAGVVIPWNKVAAYAHIKTRHSVVVREDQNDSLPDRNGAVTEGQKTDKRDFRTRSRDFFRDEEELKYIFERTYGPVKKYEPSERTKKRIEVYSATDNGTGEGIHNDEISGSASYKKKKGHTSGTPGESYLLVDGYNVIHADPDLKELSAVDIKAARDRLMDILLNFQAFRRETVILVFDAYKVEGGQERVIRYKDRLDVVFTRQAETADQYIERTAHKLSRSNRVTVASSDALEQVIIYAGGALRMSAAEFWLEIAETDRQIREAIARVK